MLKRIVLGFAVIALMVAMLVASAMPAFAQPFPPGNPPQCEKGQHRAHINAFERGDFDQVLKHINKESRCSLGLPPGEGQ